MGRTTRIIAVVLLGVAGIFAAATAYASQTPGQTGFDSDLPSFMLRSDSALLKITRLQDGGAESQHLDEYSLGISDAALYKYISAVDKAHNSRTSGSAEPQQAYIEVVVSDSEKRTIARELDLSPDAEQKNADYEIHAKVVEMSGKHYILELMVPERSP